MNQRESQAIEHLEEKRLLAIVRTNEFGTGENDPAFNIYDPHEVVARQLVNRAITDWNEVLNAFNYDGDDNIEDSGENGAFLISRHHQTPPQRPSLAPPRRAQSPAPIPSPAPWPAILAAWTKFAETATHPTPKAP